MCELPHIMVYVTLRDRKEMKGRGREGSEGAQRKEVGGVGGWREQARSSSMNSDSGHIKMQHELASPF